MLRSKKPVAACDRLLHSACRSATSGGRLRAVLVAGPIGPGVGSRPVSIAVAERFAHRRRLAIYLSALIMLRGRGDLDGRRRKQGRAENCQDCLSHRKSPLCKRAVAGQRRLAPRRVVPHITMADANYYAPAHHEAASKIIGQGNFSAKYSAGEPKSSCPKLATSDRVFLADPVQWKLQALVALEFPRQKTVLPTILISSPGCAHTK